MKELVLGCGRKSTKTLYQKTIETENDDALKEFKDPFRIDINPDVNPDLVYDLNELPLPLDDDKFDEIHAYEILEHLGTQGDWKFFLAQMDEFARVLKHDGFMMISLPKWNKKWAWGDPGHTRCLLPETFQFLDREHVAEFVGTTAMSDYRPWFTSNWKIVHVADVNEFCVGIVLQNKKEPVDGNQAESESLPV